MQLRRTVGQTDRHGYSRDMLALPSDAAACSLFAALMSIYIQKDIRAAIDEAGIKNVVNAKRLQLSGLRLCAKACEYKCVCVGVCVRCVYLANVINQFYAKISVHKFD